MRKVNIRLIFPYNWYHFRNVKIYTDQGTLLTRISHCEQQSLVINENTRSLTLRLDFFKSIIEVPKGNNELNLAVFLRFRDSFPIKYFDVLKRTCLTGKFVDDEGFANFHLSFYKTHDIWISKSKVDKSNLILGLLISSSLLALSFIEQKNDFQDLLFFISLMSVISLVMIFSEKDKLLLYDYKSRMIATGLAFILGILFLDSPFYIVLVLLFFSTVFILKTFRKIQPQ